MKIKDFIKQLQTLPQESEILDIVVRSSDDITVTYN